MTKKPRTFRVFLPWERKTSWLGTVGRARLRTVLALSMVGLFLYALRAREERAAALRATRASIANAYRATLAYRADHNGACPASAAELATGGYTLEAPSDAWGRPIRILCPGLSDPKGFDVLSDGPDGVPLGLDRVE